MRAASGSSPYSPSTRSIAASSRERGELARRAADPLTELGGASDSLALPERRDAGHAGSRRDEHAVARDLLDAPGRRSEHERLALARLVHHLLVELAHAPASVDEEDAEEAAVRDRPGVRDREPPRAGAPAHGAGGPIPDDPRPQLGELVGRVAAREHVEDVLELRARELRERIRAPRELVELVHRDLLVGADRDDLLGEHVERVARDARLLDLPRAHGARDDGRLEEVGPELREDPPLRDRVQIVPRAPDALQPARDRLRALDLDHEVDGAHVDAELERGRRDEARDLAGLQQLLDDEPLLARERAVVRAGELLAGELVDAKREPLGEAPVVDEDDRRAVRPHELEDRRIDRGPDRAARPLDADAHLDAVRERRDGERGRRRQLAHVLDRDDDLEVELLADARVDELDLAARAGDEPADLLHRPLRRREPDALEGRVDEALEPLEREREMRAALRAGDGVHLVEDHRLDPAERLARLRGEEQEERLGRGDEDVGRRPQHPAALLGRRVARAHRDRELRVEPGERASQVPLDVVVQRLERRDVEQAQPLAGRLVEAVDADQERSERLPRPRRRLDEDVTAARDRRPAEQLCRRRLGERALEPGPRPRREDVERVTRPRVPPSPILGPCASTSSSSVAAQPDASSPRA